MVAAQRVWIQGGSSQAADLFGQAGEQFEAQAMALRAAVAQLRYGEVFGGDAGRAAADTARAAIAAEAIRDPEGMARLLPPVLPA